MQNSALKLLPAAKFLPDWVELILFQEATTHHDAKQQAYHALIPIDINPKREKKQLLLQYSYAHNKRPFHTDSNLYQLRIHPKANFFLKLQMYWNCKTYF